MKNMTTRQKINLAIRLFISLLLLVPIPFLGISLLTPHKKVAEKIDISEFRGRIIESSQISYENLVNGGIGITILVPFEEAIKYDESAIMSYGRTRIYIIKPDPITPMTMLYSGISTPSGLAVKQSEFKIENKTIVVYKGAPMIKSLGILVLAITLIIISITMFGKVVWHLRNGFPKL